MACRCNDISNCRKDITLLNSVKDYLVKLKEKDDEVETSLNTLKNQCGSAFAPEILIPSVEALQFEIPKLNDDIDPLITSLSTRVTNEIIDLESDITSMQSEDYDFHSDEEDD